MENRKCKRCDIEFVPFNERHIFCCDSCRNRYNMYQIWLKNKDNPEFKERGRIRSRLWYQKNKEKHNKKMVVYMKEYYKKHYSKAARERNEK